MHTRGGDAATMHYFLRIQRTKVNYSTYTTVTTPQDNDQMIYFKAFVQISCLNVGYEFFQKCFRKLSRAEYQNKLAANQQ